jgi:hypothetical protein
MGGGDLPCSPLKLTGMGCSGLHNLLLIQAAVSTGSGPHRMPTTWQALHAIRPLAAGW